MPKSHSKPRSKRQQVRDERKEKRRQRQEDNIEAKHEAKRQRLEDGEDGKEQNEQGEGGERSTGDVFFFDAEKQKDAQPEREFFGMLADEEQEYFRHADELLELNQFSSVEDREMFLQNVYKEARGKELKLACSQSCSRLMERLVLLSNTQQKKSLFQEFATHFLSLVQHRFASHCVEALFLQSAPVVTQELGRPPKRVERTGDEEEQPQAPMEELFLYTLDELEGQLTFLLTDRFASHTLRILLVILSGRPLDQFDSKSLLRSRKKERISVPGVQTASAEFNSQLRPVPESFTMALKKIISDTAASFNQTTIKGVVTHPIGNPALQLLLELDLSQPKPSDEGGEEDQEETQLLAKLLPGAPLSLSEPSSAASRFISGMIFDPIGSRLVEAIITYAPGKIFKALQKNFFAPRIATFVKNDVSSYAAVKALNRMSKEDLTSAASKILPDIPLLVSRARFSVIKTLFERCDVRDAYDEVDRLLEALVDAVGSDESKIVQKLCFLDPEESPEPPGQHQLSKTSSAPKIEVKRLHGAQLVSALLSIRGRPAQAVQTSLLSLSEDQVLRMVTLSAQTAAVLTTALSTTARNRNFHRALVALMLPSVQDMALSQHGHAVLNVVATLSCQKESDITVSFHLKESVMVKLGAMEQDLRGTWAGRNVWKAWKGDMWRTRRSDWAWWARE